MSDLTLPAPSGGMPTRVGKYKILRQIAQGGMAEIYLATAVGIERFEKLVVLKRILPMLAANHEFVEMFLDEARIAGSLLHSNIAQVFDIGSDGGNYYFVMEFLRGEDVRHLLMKSVERHEAIPYEHIVSIITGVCSGLHYAHEMRGRDGQQLSIVHRDISPQNVFVTHDGNVKLCDFGIAKSAAQLTETRVGTLKGKIRYMSPEQCQGEPLDRRSDVFALSIVLWELITQRRLFRGKSDFEVFKAIVEEDAPRPSGFRSDVAEGLESVVMKGLARDREKRFQTAQELQIALEDWARSERVPASPVRLASYMKDLFGTPPLLTENLLEQLTEADPLAKRIRKINGDEDSGPSDSNVNHAPRRNDGVPTADSSPDHDSTIAGIMPRREDSIQELPSMTESALHAQLVSSRRSPWAIILVALLLVGGAVVGLLLFRHPKPPAVAVEPVKPAPVPIVTPPAPVEPTLPTPNNTAPNTGPNAGPMPTPQRPSSRPGNENEENGEHTRQPSTPHVKKPQQKKQQPPVTTPQQPPVIHEKKGQPLDDLLPP